MEDETESSNLKAASGNRTSREPNQRLDQVFQLQLRTSLPSLSTLTQYMSYRSIFSNHCLLKTLILLVVTFVSK